MINAKPFPPFIVRDADHFLFFGSSPSSRRQQSNSLPGPFSSWQRQLISRLSIGGQRLTRSCTFRGRLANLMLFMNLCLPTNQPTTHPLSQSVTQSVKGLSFQLCIGSWRDNIGLLYPFHLRSFVMNNFVFFRHTPLK